MVPAPDASRRRDPECRWLCQHVPHQERQGQTTGAAGSAPSASSTTCKAGRQLYGYYRNPYTDDPSISDPKHPNRRTVSNTAPLVLRRQAVFPEGRRAAVRARSEHAGHAQAVERQWRVEERDLQCASETRPHERARWWPTATRPPASPATTCTSPPCIATGRITDSVTVKVPYVSVIHDMALTHRHVVIPFGGYVTSAERLKQGKIHWGWDASQAQHHRRDSARRQREGHALVQGPGALHDARVQCALGRQQGHPVCAVLRFEFLSVLPAGGRHAMESRQGEVRSSARSRSTWTSPATTGRRRSSGPRRWATWARWIHAWSRCETRYLYTMFGDESGRWTAEHAGRARRQAPPTAMGDSTCTAGKVDRYFAGPDASAAGMQLRAARVGQGG